jgi:hypothetical protein
VRDKQLIGRKDLFLLVASGFSVWLVGFVAFGPVLRQHIMVRAHGKVAHLPPVTEEAVHLMAAGRQREILRLGPQYPYTGSPVT